MLKVMRNRRSSSFSRGLGKVTVLTDGEAIVSLCRSGATDHQRSIEAVAGSWNTPVITEEMRTAFETNAIPLRQGWDVWDLPLVEVEAQ